MSELEKTKYDAIDSLKRLCTRCYEGAGHECRVAGLINQIQDIRGIPVFVNDKLRHVVFHSW